MNDNIEFRLVFIFFFSALIFEIWTVSSEISKIRKTLEILVKQESEK